MSRARIRNFPPRPAPPGFTVIELMLAMALGSIVVITAIGMLSLLMATNSTSGRQFDETLSLAQTQQAVRTLVHALVAAPVPVKKLTETATGDASGANGNGPAGAARSAGGSGAPSGLGKQSAADTRSTAGSDDEPPEQKAPRLEIRYGRRNATGPAPSELEAVVFEPPVHQPAPAMGDSSAGTTDPPATLIRGVIEGVRIGPGEWGLQWRQIQPAAAPVIIARHLRGWKWQVLPRRKYGKAGGAGEWTDLWDCAYKEQFPTAINLQLETTHGTQVNWLFDVLPNVPVDDDGVVDD